MAGHVSECKHLNFYVQGNVNRITPKEGEDPNRWQLDLTVCCDDCKVPFRFIGLPAGVDLNGAATSVGGEEGRFAIAPRGHVLSELEGTPIGFTVRKTV